MAKRRVTKVEGASSNSNPEGKRAFAETVVRHQKSSQLISAQEKTQLRLGEPLARHRAPDRISQVSRHGECGRELLFDPMFMSRRTQARHRVTDCIPRYQWESRTEPVVSTWKEYHWMPKREQQNTSSSSGRNESQNPSGQASADPLQSTLRENEDTPNKVTKGVHLNPRSAEECERTSQKDFRKHRVERTFTNKTQQSGEFFARAGM